jgi:hypothetical protein
MKRALAALLRTLGLVPARRYDALVQEVSAIKTDRIAWKRRAAEAETRVRSLEKDLAHQARRLDKQVKAAETGPRLVIICHNTDVGDGWEREGLDNEYFKQFSEKWSYPLGINILVYAMTH